MSKTTCATVNRALRLAGYPERLTRGRGYYYFYGGDAERWYSASIPVYSIAEMTIEQILEWRAELAADIRW